MTSIYTSTRATFFYLVLAAATLSSCGDKPNPDRVRQDSLAALTASTGAFHNCPPEGVPEGSGTVNDGIANILMNRDRSPNSFETLQVTSLIQEKGPDLDKIWNKPRRDWPSKSLEAVDQRENKGAIVTGFLFEAEPGEPEPCNCNSNEFKNYHMLLTGLEGQDKISSMAAEISPRNMEAHPAWQHLAQYVGQEIRLTGWPYYDARHKEFVDSSRRGTLWQIHPVTAIEVKDSSGSWRTLQ